ncbi:MAG TPA: hypothetical protein VIK87_10410 [Sphingomonadales bacterium]
MFKFKDSDAPWMTGAAESSADLRSIGFLFNHDAPHQVAHSAPIARELSENYTGFKVTVLATSRLLLDHARKIIERDGHSRVQFVLLEESRLQRQVGRWLDAAMPFSRLMNLARHRNRLAEFDALVVPESTSLFIRRLLGKRTPKLIYTRHGNGDRSISVKRSAGEFDLVLFAGQKILDRFLEKGYLRPQQYAVVGYAKFDTLTSIEGRRFFANDRPTVLYNPHFEPKLSSFYDMGLDVLEYFYNSDKYNLIFAPHIMLFKKKLHVSLESFRMRIRRGIPERYLNCPHILVDTGSSALLDMSYTLSADYYIGDVSSQVYEFALRPRPCVFLNSHKAAWRDNPNYLFWTFGPVLDHVGDLDAALTAASSEEYIRTQEEVFRRTFDIGDRPASVRAADAIADFFRRERAAAVATDKTSELEFA